MARQSYVAGVYSACFFGQSAATGTTLTQVNQIGTGDYVLDYNLPKQTWLRCVNGYRASGLANIVLDLTFISNDPNAQKIAMGNWLNNNVDDAPTNQQYALLLIDEANDGNSLWVPICESNVKYNITRSKTKQTQVPLRFMWSENDYSVQLYRSGTISDLEGIVPAGMWPL